MKKILFISFISFFTISFAQKELWSVISGRYFSGNQDVYYGNITKYDLYGENPLIVQEFNGLNGYRPQGKLFLASNGKLYGTTTHGGTSFIPNSFDFGIGVLFEYDLILNKYKVLHNFTSVSAYPTTGLIEPFPGILYGTAGNRVFKYDIINDSITVLTGVTGYTFNGNLMKASDGNLYAPFLYGNCGGGVQPQFPLGGIMKVNTTTGIVSIAYGLSCTSGIDEGQTPLGKLIEGQPGKLYGVTRGGSVLLPDGTGFATDGTILEYNINTNVFLKVKNFYPNVEGKAPSEMFVGGDGYIYGVCNVSNKLTTCASPPSPPDLSFPIKGTIWKYNPITNELTIIKEIGTCDSIDPTQIQYPTSIFKTSLGHFMCTNDNQANTKGYFKYDPVTNLATVPTGVWPPLEDIKPNNFIEICRKPSYQEIIVNSYSPEVGSTFTYNINNTNAITNVWKKGSTILPLQTTGTLTLTNVTTNDTGVYSCTMTNECGTTVTANLNVTVTNLATETVDTYKSEIVLYPNPTKSTINLKFPENRGLKGIQYKITNLLGQVVHQAAIVAGKSQVTIDASAFPVGVYQVTLTTDKGDWNGKFVRE